MNTSIEIYLTTISWRQNLFVTWRGERVLCAGFGDKEALYLLVEQKIPFQMVWNMLGTDKY